MGETEDGFLFFSSSILIAFGVAWLLISNRGKDLCSSYWERWHMNRLVAASSSKDDDIHWKVSGIYIHPGSHYITYDRHNEFFVPL